MQLYMTGRLKSICKFEEKQVADTLVPKRASATVNIKVLQIHQLPKEYLRQSILRYCRYISCQKSICDSEYQGSADTSVAKEHLRKQITEKSPSPHRSTYFNHGTPPRKERLCNPANWSRACPTKLSRSA